MLISAFAGRNFILSAYKTAVEQKYRFFSFGDAMYISHKQPDEERAAELKERECKIVCVKGLYKSTSVLAY